MLSSQGVDIRDLRSNRRITHWVVAAAFFVMFATGLVFFVPALSGLAAGGWTRLIHRGAAVVLVGTPVIYAVTHRAAALRWLEQAAFWRKASVSPGTSNTWSRAHKSLVATGFILFVSTGAILWFLKDIMPSQVFLFVVMVHDVLFISATCVLMYHFYHELDWWLWERKYCRQCDSVRCLNVCPNAVMTRSPDGAVEYHSERCNSCKFCMQSCRRNSYYKERVRPMRADSHTE